MNKEVSVQNTSGSNNVSEPTGAGKERLIKGTFIVLSILAALAFWVTFAYATVTGNVKLATIFGHIIAIAVAVFVPFQILYTVYKKYLKS